ncbi:periplasmic flagellar collar protein FlcA [Borreliella californiensis]|uniref:Periplasmic flagellar collar protein FlcA n=1 Tax=Borreliella californiensis TaxID=373543 RepID=A0A7X0DPB7_9SPIR|nr:hypothetical protein [Borreliella californiensis]MBB6213046.1 tetratricopeptide (TPR) repeat protein [Borreliella californiensis]WKC91620.1 hypothetical protein QIA17_02140 [Borreliella californiensis]WNY70376.1 hypothetical protein QIA39_01605 [Borreliella californiensis]
MPDLDKIIQFKREILDNLSNERLSKESFGVSMDVKLPEPGERIVPWISEDLALEENNDELDLNFMLDALESEDKLSYSDIFNDNLPLSGSDLKVDVDSELSTLNNDFDVSSGDFFENDIEKAFDDNSIDLEMASKFDFDDLTNSSELSSEELVKNQSNNNFFKAGNDSSVSEDSNFLQSNESNEFNIGDAANGENQTDEQSEMFAEDSLNLSVDEDDFENVADDFKFLEYDQNANFKRFEFKVNYPLFLKHLNSYPRNLRIAIAEALTKENVSRFKLEALIDLVEKNTKRLKFIAKFVGDIVGRSIKLPVIYFKAEEFSKLQQKLSYRVSRALLPLIKIASLFVVLVLFFLYLIVDVVFFYVASESKYKEGIESIYANKRELAKAIFRDAYYIRPNDKWFVNYAKAFEDVRDFDSAEEKYEELFTIEPFSKNFTSRRRKKFNKEGYIAYASMKINLGEHSEANSILDEVISYDLYDYDALVLKGDNYFKWAKINSNYYKDSINSYTVVLSKYGQKKEILFKLFNAYIEANLDTESDNVNNFIKSNEILDIDEVVYTKYVKKLVDKYISFVTYNRRANNLAINLNYLNGQTNLLNKEFSGFKRNDGRTVFKLDNNVNMNSEIEYILRKILNKNPNYDKALFESGRYSYYIGDFKKAEVYLLKALNSFRQINSIEDAEDKILAYKILADIYEKSRDSLRASNIIGLALSDYSFYKKHNLIKGSKEVSSIYEKQGDILRSLNDFKSAISSYKLAINEGVDYPDVYYKVGLLSYRENNYDDALKYLFKVESMAGFSSSNEVLNSIALTLYKIGDFLASRSYYLRVMQNLELEKANVLNFNPKENDYHKTLLLKEIETYNNLGVVEVMASFSSIRDAKLFNSGVSNLSESAKIFDILNRDEDMVKSVKKDLASLNLRNIFKNSFSKSNVLFYENLSEKL